MMLETFTADTVSAALAAAHQALGPDAMMIEMRRLPTGYQLIACRSGYHAPIQNPHLAQAKGPPTDLTVSEFRPQLNRSETSPAVIVLVGPTGVGKTTSVAKLATHPGVFGSRNVGILGLDTFRIGAVEQLLAYADLAQLQCEVVYEGEDIPRALKRLSHCDIVVVDTPGRGPHQPDDLALVRQWIQRLTPVEVHLLLPAGMQEGLAQAVLNRFQRFGLTHIMATKVDEWPHDDTPFRIAALAGLAMRWQTDGQEVPIHLKPAAPGLIAAASHRSMTPSLQEAVA